MFDVIKLRCMMIVTNNKNFHFQTRSVTVFCKFFVFVLSSNFFAQARLFKQFSLRGNQLLVCFTLIIVYRRFIYQIVDCKAKFSVWRQKPRRRCCTNGDSDGDCVFICLVTLLCVCNVQRFKPRCSSKCFSFLFTLCITVFRGVGLGVLKPSFLQKLPRKRRNAI